MQVDERGPRRLAAPRRLDELLERRRQLGQVGLRVLGAGRGDGVQGAGGGGGRGRRGGWGRTGGHGPIMAGTDRRICGDQPLTTTVCAAEMPSTRRSTSVATDRLTTASATFFFTESATT